jgi:hypothetical protein
MLKPTLVRLTFNHIFQLLGMTTWGVGSILLNVHAKFKHNEDLVVVIRTTQTTYAKALKGVWMECDWKFASNKTMQLKEIGFLCNIMI